MFISPMLLQKRDLPFDDPNYIYEPKMDGIRLLLSKVNKKVKLYTRHENEVTNRFPELLQVPIEDDVILDGELIALNRITGKVDFERVMERFMSKKNTSIQIQYVVFDILFYKGKDLRPLPLLERKEILNKVLTNNGHFVKIQYIEDQGIPLFDAAKRMDLEGTVCKLKQSPYESKRSWNWIKLINWKYENVFITGFKKGEFGWLIANEELKPMGILELGTTPTARKAFHGVAQQLITHEDKTTVYIDPRIKIKVKFRNYTKNNYLRTPSFCEFLL